MGTKKTPKVTVKSQQERIDKLEEALNIARSGLFKIINLNPVNYTKVPPAPKSLGIVGALKAAQRIADKTVLDMSDAEGGDNESS